MNGVSSNLSDGSSRDSDDTKIGPFGRSRRDFDGTGTLECTRSGRWPLLTQTFTASFPSTIHVNKVVLTKFL